MPADNFQQKLQRQPKNSGIVSFVVQFFVVAIAFFAIGFVVGQKKIDVTTRNFTPNITVENKLPLENQNVDFSLFWQVFETLPKTYLDKTAVNGEEMLYGAISGMVRSLGDPYTAFLDPSQNAAIKDELAGSYEGVGIQIGFNSENRLVVIAPLRGTPAERVGVRAKDLILKIGDKDTFDITLPEAVELIRGRAGTFVSLTLQREGAADSYSVDIERAEISVKSVELEYRDVGGKKIGVIKVSRFGENTDSEWDDAVNQVQLDGADAVVVDMRNNPGGLLTSAVHLSSEFVSGTVVMQEFSDGSRKSLEADHRGELLDIPLVVLVNSGSASASEIFAGAIKDYNRGQIVGELTFGKGTVQDALEFPGGSGLHVTVAKWLTPKGSSIHGEGISPSIEVSISDEDIEQERDPQLERALELL
jgi:carboxyl-terminal processing protease